MATRYYINLPDPARARGNDPDLAFRAQGAEAFASELQDEENPDYFLLEGDELDLEELLEEEPVVLFSFFVEGALAAFFALEEFIMVSVTPPTLPSAVSPARFWKAFTASSVISPKYPVAFALER